MISRSFIRFAITSILTISTSKAAAMGYVEANNLLRQAFGVNATSIVLNGVSAQGQAY